MIPWAPRRFVVGVEPHLDPDCAHLSMLEFSAALADLGHGFVAEDWDPYFEAEVNRWWVDEVPASERLFTYRTVAIHLEPIPGTNGKRISFCPRVAWERLQEDAARRRREDAPAPAAVPSPSVPVPAAPPAPLPVPAVDLAPAPVAAGPKGGAGLLLGLGLLGALAVVVGSRR